MAVIHPHFLQSLEDLGFIARVISGVFVRPGSYTCNCFLCLATIFPRFASCAKWMSRCCGCLCCGQIDAFREDCVKVTSASLPPSAGCRPCVLSTSLCETRAVNCLIS